MATIEQAPKVSIFETPVEAARAFSERFVRLARSAGQERGRFTVALSGGFTPRTAYELLASEEFQGRVDWSKVHLFFGDERCVPLDDAESNYRMANEALLSRVPVPEKNVHRIEGMGDALANARLYEDELRTYFKDEAWPRLDLILLGMGEDGHTASLFPHSIALKEQRAWVAPNWVETLRVRRITLTAPAINHARNITFLVTGAGKAERLLEVLSGVRDPERLPAQLIRPTNGTLEWLVDQAAAARLNS